MKRELKKEYRNTPSQQEKIKTIYEQQEKRIQQKKEYKQSAKYKEHQSQKISCECGSSVSRSNFHHHIKSIKHQEYLSACIYQNP
jgi:hypothetical protein